MKRLLANGRLLTSGLPLRPILLHQLLYWRTNKLKTLLLKSLEIRASNLIHDKRCHECCRPTITEITSIIAININLVRFVSITFLAVILSYDSLDFIINIGFRLHLIQPNVTIDSSDYAVIITGLSHRRSNRFCDCFQTHSCNKFSNSRPKGIMI